MPSPVTASLFCGAGGETCGKVLALQELGIDCHDMLSHAVNHWDLAVLTHGRNFPWIHVHQEDVTKITAKTFQLEHINLLWASPSCVHHSRARGGKPKDDQQRSHADEVVDRWLRVADVDVLLVENVPEFEEWGPLDENGDPIKSRKGEFFARFIMSLRSLGYNVEWRVLCAADYGDATIRRRFFLQATKDGIAPSWPAQTHRNPASRSPVDASLPPWRTAAEIIDWSLPMQSIFGRSKPLSDKTLRRIAKGVMKFVATGRPFIVNMRGTSRSQIESSAASIDSPLKTISAGGRHAALVTAFLAKHYTGVTGTPVSVPLGTVTQVDHHSVVECTLHRKEVGDVGGNLVAAFITQYYSNGGEHTPMTAPLCTVTTKQRHSLVTVEIAGDTWAVTDIKMRMLQPHELASAMGFPPWYEFKTVDGKVLNKTQATKMIGNACPVNTVKELVKAVVLARPAAYGAANPPRKGMLA